MRSLRRPARCCTLAAAHSQLGDRMKMDGPYDNRVLPVVLSAIMIVALSIVFGGAVVQFVQG